MATLTAETIGFKFVEQYYGFFHDSPEKLHQLFGPSASFSVKEEGSTESLAKGDTIGEQIESLKFDNCCTEILHVDCQTVPSENILIQVIGWLYTDNNPSRKFSQTFFLSRQEQKRFVLTSSICTLLAQDFEQDVENESPVPNGTEAASAAETETSNHVPEAASPEPTVEPVAAAPSSPVKVTVEPTPAPVSAPAATAPAASHAANATSSPEASPAGNGAPHPDKPRHSRRGGSHRSGHAAAHAAAAAANAAATQTTTAAAAPSVAPVAAAPAASPPKPADAPAAPNPQPRSWAQASAQGAHPRSGKPRSPGKPGPQAVVAAAPVAATAPAPAATSNVGAAPKVTAAAAVAGAGAAGVAGAAAGAQRSSRSRGGYGGGYGRDSKASELSLYMPSVPISATINDIKAAFAHIGVVNASIQKSTRGAPYNFAFVEFADPAILQRSLAQCTFSICGVSVHVERRKPAAPPSKPANRPFKKSPEPGES